MLLGTGHGPKGQDSELAGPQPAEPPWQVANDWSGTWRDGMTDGWRLPPSPAELAAAGGRSQRRPAGPGTPEPRRAGAERLVRGRSRGFLPSAGSVGVADGFLSRGEDVAIRGVSAPIVFVSGR